ncbi:DUF4040 domain-containing protein [Ferrimonas balearica]|uniref:DUF4040 domain-containing protein n=1 Tax=Ferrimonas balearica TaxID=44012 RepID=UPI001F24C219|nr:DUF4040 domain-containing protein [Ferrimonas balearica]MBY6016211.1 DUF4040 domain-containing protein [Halomonas denitrificans]MBY6095520.1 DUF4040 domain-containing protein [Ferrimonas balearica]
MEFLLDIVLLSLLVLTALAIVRTRDLFACAMLTGIYSLLSASFFVLMDAVDVAFTEAAVGAGISTLLMLAALTLTGRFEKPHTHQARRAITVIAIITFLMLYGLEDMPRFGDPDAPAQRHVAEHYLEDGFEEVGVPNLVTSVLASYRGFDTFGETVVVFTAGIGVLALLARRRQRHPSKALSDGHRMENHLILRVVSRFLVPPILLFALYVQFHGDFGPGGGFQAGVIFAAGLILYAMVFGLEALRKVIPETVIRVLAALGVLLYGSVGMVALLQGKPFLDYRALADDNIAGQHLGIWLVELGVGITVAAVMLLLFMVFSARYDRGAE